MSYQKCQNTRLVGTCQGSVLFKDRIALPTCPLGVTRNQALTRVREPKRSKFCCSEKFFQVFWCIFTAGGVVNLRQISPNWARVKKNLRYVASLIWSLYRYMLMLYKFFPSKKTILRDANLTVLNLTQAFCFLWCTFFSILVACSHRKHGRYWILPGSLAAKAPEKKPSQKERIIFQPSFFQG